MPQVKPGLAGAGVIQITPQIRILVAIEAVDGRKGVDSLAPVLPGEIAGGSVLGLFVLRSRRGTSIRILIYDPERFWLSQKRLSKECPSGNEPTRALPAHQAQMLLAVGNPEAVAAPVWWCSA